MIWRARDNLLKVSAGFPVESSLPASTGDTGYILIQEDPTGHAATKPSATTTEPVLGARSGNYRNLKWEPSPLSATKEKSPHINEDPAKRQTKFLKKKASCFRKVEQESPPPGLHVELLKLGQRHKGLRREEIHQCAAMQEA